MRTQLKKFVQLPVLTKLSPSFEAICKHPVYNIEIVKRFEIADSTIYEYDASAPNKNTYIGTAKENIQSALIACYTAALK